MKLKNIKIKKYKIFISNLDDKIRNEVKLLKYTNINMLNDNNNFEFL